MMSSVSVMLIRRGDTLGLVLAVQGPWFLNGH